MQQHTIRTLLYAHLADLRLHERDEVATWALDERRVVLRLVLGGLGPDSGDPDGLQLRLRLDQLGLRLPLLVLLDCVLFLGGALVAPATARGAALGARGLNHTEYDQ